MKARSDSNKANNTNKPNKSSVAGRVIALIDILVMIAAIAMGIAFASMTPLGQDIDKFCSKSSNISESECKATLSTSLGITYSTSTSNSVTCFGVAVIAFLFLANSLGGRQHKD